jgi:outer membrane receptor protein involved in Fe transport
VSLDCDNVFDKTYYIGGTSYFPYQYPRRMVMGTLSFDF